MSIITSKENLLQAAELAVEYDREVPGFGSFRKKLHSLMLEIYSVMFKRETEEIIASWDCYSEEAVGLFEEIFSKLGFKFELLEHRQGEVYWKSPNPPYMRIKVSWESESSHKTQDTNYTQNYNPWDPNVDMPLSW